MTRERDAAAAASCSPRDDEALSGREGREKVHALRGVRVRAPGRKTGGEGEAANEGVGLGGVMYSSRVQIPAGEGKGGIGERTERENSVLDEV